MRLVSLKITSFWDIFFLSETVQPSTLDPNTVPWFLCKNVHLDVLDCASMPNFDILNPCRCPQSSFCEWTMCWFAHQTPNCILGPTPKVQTILWKMDNKTYGENGSWFDNSFRIASRASCIYFDLKYKFERNFPSSVSFGSTEKRKRMHKPRCIIAIKIIYWA